MIVASKFYYKCKLIALTLDEYAAIQELQDLEGIQVDLLQCMLWIVAI